MSKMIIYFCLFAPLLFLSADSSSIRGRNNKNDLVPFLSSRFDAMKRDPNSMKVVSKDPFIIQLHMPNSKEMEARGAKEKDKKRKRPAKKRLSKLKPLRKKHRKRRDLLTSKTKPREEKLFRFEIPRAANNTERLLKNTTKNSVNRMEILKALSSYPKRAETKRNKLEGIRQDEEKIYTGKTKKNNTSNRNLHKHHLSLSDRSKLVYPNTPKLDRRPQKYTYKDLVADRERLEQKIKYIKNMLNANVTTTDDGTRVRRRSDSDRTANKIAKMFLTLSAVNGLNDKKKSKCDDDDDDDDDRVDDVWEKERRNNPLRKSTSSNEERYKIKKWIEFMKNKRSSGKTCPCMRNSYGEESDAFPLEQKLPKGYFLMERGRSSEESSESYRDQYYYSKDKINRNDNVKKRLSKAQEQDNKNKALSKNGKRRLDVPFEDLELYRSRARQILRNAEEILDKIKEEEEKRLATPNILMSQLKELTARIHGDPRNNENDLIRKIQKNLGWGPLSTPQEESDGTFMDNVKSFILDPYEKAKALTDESAKKLSSYLLRNLGKLQESSEEQEMTNAADKTDDGTLKIYLGGVPNEEKPSFASLAKEQPRADGLSKSKEDLQNWEDTLSTILSGGNDAVNKESNWNVDREEPSLQEMEDVVKNTQKKLNNYEDQLIKKINNADDKESMKIPQIGEDIIAESKPESILEEEKVAMTLNEKEKDYNTNHTTGFQLKNEKGEKEPGAILEKIAKDSDIKKQPFRETEGTYQEKDVQASRDMQEEEEKVAMILKEKEKDENKLDNTGFQSKSEKGTKSEESGEILKETEKDSDITKKQPFRGTEGTHQGKEGESDVQASRNMQKEEETVAMTLNENEKDNNEQYTTGFQLKNGKGIENTEKPGAILEKGARASGITSQKQPFRGMEGTLQGKEGESNVQGSRDMQEEEERVEMTLNEKEEDENTGFQLKNGKDDKEIKSAEESTSTLGKTAKGLDTTKKQPFRGIEGAYQEKEGESDVQTSRNMQEEKGENVAMTLKENEEYDDTKDTRGFQLENEKDKKGIKNEVPGSILKKAQKDLDIIKKQPFPATGKTHPGEEGKSDVQASRDMQEEKEEKLAMILNEKEKDGNKLDNTGFQSKNEKGTKSEESGEILKETEKDSHNTKKQPFRGTEGTHQGKEGESDVQASRDMQEEEEFKKEFEEIVKMLTDNENEGPKTDEVVRKSDEEKDANEDVVSQILEKQEENEKVAIAASLESEKTASVEETSDDSATEETVGKKSDLTYPSITLIDGAPPTDSGLDTPVKSEQKETGKADLADEFESNEEYVLEKQRELYGEQSEEEVKVEENKSKNFKEGAEAETEKESPLVSGEVLKESRTEDSLIEDITQKEIGVKKLPEYADLVQEAKKVEGGDSEDERRIGNEEILELNNKETISKENADGEVLKAVLDNKETTEDKLESASREGSTEDLNTPLRATLNQKASNQPLDQSSSKESDDVLLKEYKSDEQKKESLEENIKDEILAKERNNETLFPVEKPSDDNQSSVENNDDTLLKESNTNEAFDSVKEGGETLLKEALSNQDQDAVETQEYKSGEVSEGGFDEDSSEINLKASLDKNEELEKDDEVNFNKDKDLEKDDGIILKASNRYGLDETQNSSEEKDVFLQKENQQNDYQRESTENLEKILDTQKDLEDEKSTEDVGNQRENEETDSEERGIMTLEKAVNIQETLDKENEEATASKENQNAKNINEKGYGETIVRAEKPDENDEETYQGSVKSMSNEEMENLKGREDEEIIKEANPDENVQDEKSELLEEILKEIQDNQKQEATQVDEDELASNKPREDDYLEAVLKDETQENLKEKPDGEILKAERVDDESVRSQEETNLEATLEGQDNDVVLKEINFEDPKEKQDDLEDGEDVRAVFDNQEKFDEVSQNINQDMREQNEDMDDEKILLKADNFEEELNNQNPNDETLRAVLSEQDEENLEENFKNLQAENPEKDRDETPLKSATLEDEFDNKIDYETALKSAQFSEKPDVEYINVNEDEREETLRAENVPKDFSNQIDEKNEEEAFLESAHLDPKSPYENGYSYVTVTEDNVEAKYPLKTLNREDENSQDNLQEWGPIGDPQKPDPNSLKASKLKVPKWIGKIMKDLDGKEKTDVTSMKNLNPEKIDDMLGKIGKAEQQNLLEGEEVDCRKECACAEEMNTRSRNIGRYEIVKDFLHWVKDLQLNRVLSDE